MRTAATPYNKIVIPVTYRCDAQSLVYTARLIAGEGLIILKGIVGVPPDQSLSTGAIMTRHVRETIHELEEGEQVQSQGRVRVSHNPWDEIMDTVQDEQPDLLVLEWPNQFEELQITPLEALIRPPCEVMLVRGPIPEVPDSVLVPLRGIPYAEHSLRLALAIAQSSQSRVTSFRLVSDGPDESETRTYKGLAQVLDNLPEVDRRESPETDPAEQIIDLSRQYDLVVMGVTTNPEEVAVPVGPVTERVLRDSMAGVIAIKSRRTVFRDGEEVGQRAISILVDKWFAENTYHTEEFVDLDYLLSVKEEQGLSVSLALPALNEEETVGRVIESVRGALMDDVPILDEMVLMDSDSSDHTRKIAESLGIPVFIHQQILPQYGARPGKGEALWKSLYITKGDIILWVDTDIVNIHPRFVYGLLGPLLANPSIQFIKGFYRRPLKVGDKMQAGGGGRVTELTARPMINLFFPELSGVVQPLSGEYGGRRSALEQLTFYSGYGVETGLLIDVFEKFGLSAIAQVDLMKRVHHNQPLVSLSKMSFAIIQVVIRKLESRYGIGIMEEVNKSMKLIRFEADRYYLEVEEIAERERPPMLHVPEYRQRHKK
jgi:glycosyltransferase involved in cell wall biosynthesis/nucleotide-binding universal stress UspA family protein